MAMKEEGYETIMVNCNPETVSTDYDTSDRLYFEPITLEDVLAIIELENPYGVIIQFGGQTPLKLAQELEKNKVPILGTSPDKIDLAEDRERFQQFVNENKLKQPPNGMASNKSQAKSIAHQIGYPIVVRPSYVLGGRAMEIVHNDNDLEKYLDEAIQASNSNPVLLERGLDIATQLDIEAISDGSQVEIYGVMQHIEQAGIHSGDSACSLPPYSLPDKVIKKIKEQVRVIAKEMDIIGLMNVQMAYANEEIFLLEVNPRASRTIPFVSKAIGLPLAKIASKTMIGKSLKQQKIKNPSNLNHFSVKEAVLPFDRFQNVDPILGPEMKSTGEVMGIGTSFAEAYDKSQISAGTIIPDGGSVFLSVRENDKPHLEELVTRLDQLNLSIVATKGTAREIQNMGIKARIINKVAEGRPHVVDLIKNNEISLLINTTEGKESIQDSSSIRRTALDNKIPCTTTLQGGLAICEVLEKRLDWSVQTIQDIHKSIE